MSAPASRDVHITEALLVLMSIIWGMNFAVMKYGTDVLEPLAYNGVRLVLGSAVMYGILKFRKEPRLPWSDIRGLMWLGALGTGLYQLFFITGLAMTRAGKLATETTKFPHSAAPRLDCESRSWPGSIRQTMRATRPSRPSIL